MKKIPNSATCSSINNSIIPRRVEIDREKAGLSGVAVKDVTDALLVGTSSSRYVVKNYSARPATGVDYQVQIQVPTQRMDRPQQVENMPIKKMNSENNLLVRDVATATPARRRARSTAAPCSILEHHRERRGQRLGPRRSRYRPGYRRRRQAARGVHVSVRGQVAPMTEMFRSLTIGLRFRSWQSSSC